MARFLTRLNAFSPRQATAWLPALAWLIALALLAWLAARWSWLIVAPAPQRANHIAISDPAQAARELASHHIFGDGQGPAGPETVLPPARYRVLGIAANSGTSPGFVILQENDLPAFAAIEGEEISPGVKLSKIRPQSIELDRGGAIETLQLINANPVSTPGNAFAPGPAGAPPPPAPSDTTAQRILAPAESAN